MPAMTIQIKRQGRRMRDNFVVFILSHGRADTCITAKALKDANYTGDWFIVVDDEDLEYNKYIDNFGSEHVRQFHKAGVECDSMDNFPGRLAILYARNECFNLAREMGYTYFLELDDDYLYFFSRFIKDGDTLSTIYVRDFDAVCEAMLDFLDESGAVTIAMAQNGDFIGGKESRMYRAKIVRKAMNAFFCRVDRPFKFSGRLNEDVNAYITEGSRGLLFMTVRDLVLKQHDTQQYKGGLSEAYASLGTYVKSFYTVMANPSSVKISMMVTDHSRIHHVIDWNSAVPKIISSKYRKE